MLRRIHTDDGFNIVTAIIFTDRFWMNHLQLLDIEISTKDLITIVFISHCFRFFIFLL